MRLHLLDDLPFVTARLTFGGASIDIPHVLVDTGAQSTVLSADLAGEIGVFLTGDAQLRRLRGVGGHEFVFVRRVDRLAIGDHGVDDFEVELGELDYGFDLGGILGMDYLRAARAVIDLGALEIDLR